jgi:hypothetical protein
MPTFYYIPNENPQALPAYIETANAPSRNSKWYDSNRSWNSYWSDWRQYLGGTKSHTDKVVPHDDLPYDHEYPFGVDPNDPSKPYAPYGLFPYDEHGNPANVVNIYFLDVALKAQLKVHPDPSDPASPLNVYSVTSPMDPYNMRRFFYGNKPGSPWHLYQRRLQLDEFELEVTQNPNVEIGYRSYLDDAFRVKDTPENFPWVYDQDPSHHYRVESLGDIGSDYIDPVIKIYLDSPAAPVGWTEVK